MRFAVAGHPVLHSKSPTIYNSIFRSRDFPGHYSRLAASSAVEALNLFREIGLAGMTVTVPFNTEMIQHLQSLDPEAAGIGVVNVVMREGDGLKGFNTDHVGVSVALESHGVALAGKRAMVVGAGGAGRAAAYALVRGGSEVTVLDRDAEEARVVAGILGCAGGPLADLAERAAEADILVVTAHPDALDLGSLPLRPGLAVLDAVNDDPVDDRAARAEIAHDIRGEEWLKHQTIPILRLLLGTSVPAEAVDWPRALQDDPRPRRETIALTGFMGAGKTTIARGLASRLGYDFLDVDDWIVTHEGRSIRDILASSGEASFRKMEHEAIARFAGVKRLVLACGGGAMMDEDNRRALADRALTIWIYTALGRTFARSDLGGRPLLDHPSPSARAAELLEERIEDYFRSADLIVGNEGPPDRAVERIHEEIRRAR